MKITQAIRILSIVVEDFVSTSANINTAEKFRLAMRHNRSEIIDDLEKAIVTAWKKTAKYSVKMLRSRQEIDRSMIEAMKFYSVSITWQQQAISLTKVLNG